MEKDPLVERPKPQSSLTVNTLVVARFVTELCSAGL
jgi:hypothetical protein